MRPRQVPGFRRFTPFGAPRGEVAGSWPDRRGFLGKPVDADTGLTDVGARKYDPVLGRFLSLDPVFDPADPQSLNGYAYANGNPATFSDPTGLYACLPGECGKTKDNRNTPSTGNTAPLPRADAGTGGGDGARGPRFCDGCAGLAG